MTNLKKELKKIYDFVNCEFDIENESAINEVKESLELEKLDTLDKMIISYKKELKKAVNAEKRKEAQKEAQKNYKVLATNLKLEEFTKYEEDARNKNLTISEYVKNALSAFIAPKKLKEVEIPIPKIDNALQSKYEALKRELEEYKVRNMELNKKVVDNNESLKLKAELLEKQKLLDSFEIEKQNLNAEIVKQSRASLPQDKVDIEELTKEIKRLNERGLFARLFNL